MKDYSLRERFGKLASGEREHFLERARDSSKITIPSLIRENWEDGGSDMVIPYQSVGARGVSNLSSKLLLALFPPTTPFFRLLVSEKDLEEIPQEQRDLVRGEIEDSLREIEQAVFEEIEDSNFRITVMEAMKQLVVAGNACFYIGAEQEFRNYSLEDYVVARDMEGNLLEVIVRERVAKEVAAEYDLLPEDDTVKLASSDSTLPSERQNNVNMYTCARRIEGSKFEIRQELNGKTITLIEEVEEEKLPFLVIRLTSCTGESYGRSYVEHLMGDLQTLESLSQSIVQSAALASKTTYFVNPGSLIRPKALAEAENGAVLPGNAGDVTVLQSQKGADLAVVSNVANALEQRLGLAFLLFENAVRDSERTTAFEVQQLIQSLEQVLAGTYAILNQTFVRPFLNVVISRMTEEGKIPELPDSVKLIISTGLTNLGRFSELQKLQQFYQLAVQVVGPEAALQLVDPVEMVNRIATAVGVEKKGLVKSRMQIEEERRQAELEAQRMQTQQMMQQLAVNAGNTMIEASKDPEQAERMAAQMAALQEQIQANPEMAQAAAQASQQPTQ